MSELREQILCAADLKTESVDVPEWGIAVMVRCMTGRERDAFEQQQSDLEAASRSNENIRARLVALTCIDHEGTRIFSDADADALGNKASAALERVAKVALRLNRITEADVKELEGK